MVHSGDDFGASYPPKLREAEERLLATAPRWKGRVDPGRLVGFGLSGGGIRSATFALGLFQGLAKLGLLGKIDYLSTVSGGGYFGSFLGRLYGRPFVASSDDVAAALCPPDEPARDARPGAAERSRVFPWLRANGRYLSPNGSGDMMLGGAVLFRNWVALQVVLFSFALFVCLTCQAVRLVGCRLLPFTEHYVWELPFGLHLWGSPWLLLAVLAFGLWAFPLGWADWLVGARGHRVLPFEIHPAWGLGAAMAVSAAVLLYPPEHWTDTVRLAAAFVLVAAVLALVSWASAVLVTRRPPPERWEKTPEARLQRTEEARHWLSLQLKQALACAALATVFTLLDSVAQSIYALIHLGESSIEEWTAGTGASLVAAAGLARKAASLASPESSDKRPSLPVGIAATLAAVFVVAFLLVCVDTLAHGFAWSFRPPVAPAIVEPEDVADPLPGETAGGLGLTVDPDNLKPVKERDPEVLLAALVISGLFTVFFGRSWPFLNRSSQLGLYSARLIRAYLGASNPRRLSDFGPPVTQVVPGDDAPPWEYFPDAEDPTSAVTKGAPLHLINVTINETVDSRHKVQQQDRKGIGMTIGPCGLSAGVRHHALLRWADGKPSAPEAASPPVRVWPLDESSYRMFGYDDGRFDAEPLSVGRWLGISGAAFSTGLGARTNLGLSLLAGLANVRLGYWWDSGVEHPKSSRPTLLQRLLPVHAYFLAELTARFEGTAQPHWYLTDGGHFENLGGYELLRRRVPLVVLVDAEADPDYTFEGLSELVRKARLDFGADVRFLDEAELAAALPADLYPVFGTLERLRRGNWEAETLPSDPGERHNLAPERSQTSLAHATLARVTYDGDAEPGSWIVYVKPTLCGHEPLDVRRYHLDNPDFPQQTTMDQFFDEAQWESYRKLGQHIAERVFAPGSEEPGKLRPGALRPPSPAKAPRRSRGGGGAGVTQRRSHSTASDDTESLRKPGEREKSGMSRSTRTAAPSKPGSS